ncbi:hypothetical protein [Rhodococcoides fascians]|uniref:hypothetical protein n=1 Tax=Rhodococcoides fascians TaxID=1828 RepID=UPI0005662FBE|nr:hypothetical protein [Rhodococcus fascians]
MARIKHKTGGYTGTLIVAATRLDFKKGVATVDANSEVLARLSALGYGIMDDNPSTLAERTVPELRSLAEEQGVDLDGATRKDEIVAVLTEGTDDSGSAA